MKLTHQQEELLEWVKAWHGEQKRKYSFAPYWTHLYKVAETVAKYEKTTGVIEIALCHDLLEDTQCEEAELVEKLAKIGYDKRLVHFIVAGTVSLSDVYTWERFPELNRKERRKLEASRLGKIDAVFQSIKYADLIDNTHTIADDDPGFARKYLIEIVEILNQMREGNIHLLLTCCYTVKTALLKLDISQ